MTTYVNIFAGPCSGKSTTAAGLFYQMKLRHLNVELITEYAKDLAYSQTLQIFQNYQECIFTEQNRRQSILRNKVDWAITDSPILLSHIYGIQDKPTQITFLNLVTETFNSYNNINFFLDRPNTPHQETGRDHTLQQSIEIDKTMIALLNRLEVPYTRIPTDQHTVNTIISYVMK